MPYDASKAWPMSHCVALYYVILYYTVIDFAILYSILLYYAILQKLFYSILYYTFLYSDYDYVILDYSRTSSFRVARPLQLPVGPTETCRAQLPSEHPVHAKLQSP